jgi:hypothetical protein
MPDKVEARKLDWASIFKVTAEVSAVASILAFFLSCVINSMVFARWNHDFLQLATPSDVLMSGTRLLGYTGWPIFLAIVFVACFLLYLSRFYVIDKWVNNIPSRYYYLRRVAKFFDNLLLFGSLVIWFLLFVYALQSFIKFSPTVEICIGIFLLTAGVMGSAQEFLFLDESSLEGWRIKVVFWTYMLASLLCGSLLTRQWLFDRVDAQAAVGFHRQELAVFREGKDICGGGSRLLWSGSDSSLVECPTSGPERAVLVQRNAENVNYVPRRHVAEWRARTAARAP